MLRVAVIIALAGCDGVFGLDRLVSSDAAIDADDPVDARTCFGTEPVVVCMLALPTTPLRIDADQAFDTTSVCRQSLAAETAEPAYDDLVQPLLRRVHPTSSPLSLIPRRATSSSSRGAA